jgi:hypothetical protein
MYAVALRGRLRIPNHPIPILLALAANGAVWVAALYRPIGEAPWEPVMRVTPRLVGGAKALLGFVILLVAGTFMYLRWPRTYSNEGAFPAFVISAALVQMVFLAIYWGVRPENMFPAAWIRHWNSSNPALVRLIKKARVNRTRANRGRTKRHS